jgi:hypothetical protein
MGKGKKELRKRRVEDGGAQRMTVKVKGEVR